jgi:hypothetical protein
LLAARKDEAPSSKEIIVHGEQAQKIELMLLSILKAKRLEGYVNGDSIEPKDKLSAEWKDWEATNSLVAVWMLSSMVPPIASTVEQLSVQLKCGTP